MKPFFSLSSHIRIDSFSCFLLFITVFSVVVVVIVCLLNRLLTHLLFTSVKSVAVWTLRFYEHKRSLRAAFCVIHSEEPHFRIISISSQLMDNHAFAWVCEQWSWSWLTCQLDTYYKCVQLQADNIWCTKFSPMIKFTVAR